VYNFLLVINSNLGPISLSRTVTEIQRLIGQKWQIFPTPSHLAPSFGVTPFEFIEKTLWFLKLESSKQPTIKIW